MRHTINCHLAVVKTGRTLYRDQHGAPLRIRAAPAAFASAIEPRTHALPPAPTRSGATALYFPPSTRYTWLRERRKSASPTTAGLARNPSSNRFSASFSNSRPALSTVTTPFSPHR